MSVATRLATMLFLAIQLAAVVVPCPTAQPPAHERGLAAVAGHSAGPCPSHADDAPSTWLDALCPCGCQTGAAPSSGTSPPGTALLLSELAFASAAPRDLPAVSPLQLPRFSPAPPDHVPLIA